MNESIGRGESVSFIFLSYSRVNQQDRGAGEGGRELWNRKVKEMKWWNRKVKIKKESFVFPDS